MAQDVEMIPVEATEPPKVNPLSKPLVNGAKTIKLSAPQIRRPSGMTQSALRPGLKLPPKPGLAPGLKLPTKPALSPGLKLPSAPVIRKPGATVAASPLPKPVTAPVAPKPAPTTPALEPVPAAPKPAVPPANAAPAAEEAKTPVADAVKTLEALKSATQKLKGVTQPIPQQAILRKTGIIADTEMTDAQKQAAKHKTARISLSDAIGVAPVNNENAPMKTIRIKRPIDIPGATSSLAKPPAAPSAESPAENTPVAEKPTLAPAAAGENPTIKTNASAMMTQRKTLKISRPSSAVRPTGKFTAKRPTVAKKVEGQKDENAAESSQAQAADIPDIPNIPDIPASKPAEETVGWVFTLSSVVQLAACGVIGALAWYLYQNTQTQYF